MGMGVVPKGHRGFLEEHSGALLYSRVLNGTPEYSGALPPSRVLNGAQRYRPQSTHDAPCHPSTMGQAGNRQHAHARRYIFRGMNPEEPIATTGYICHFSDLTIRAVQVTFPPTNPCNTHRASHRAIQYQRTPDRQRTIAMQRTPHT